MLVFVHVHASPEHSVHSIHAILCNLFFRQHSSISKTKWKFRIIMYGSALFIWNLLLDIPLFHVFSQTGNCWQQLPAPYKRPEYNTINWRDTTHFDSEDDYRTGCQNVSHCQQQQSYSGLHSPGQLLNSTYFWNDSWVQTFHNDDNDNDDGDDNKLDDSLCS